MKIKTAIIVVASTAVIFLVGLAAVAVVGRLAQAVRREMSSETARQQFVTAWRPPADTRAEVLFPRRVFGFELPATNAVPPPPFAPGFPGLRARYLTQAEPGIEVCAGPATPAESDALFAQVRTAFDGRNGTRSVVESPGRLRLSGSAPEQTVELWSLGGWIFLFRSDGELPADFIREYLTAIRGAQSP